MILYSLSPLIISIILLFVGIFVYTKNRKNNLNKVFFLLSLASAVWLFSYSIAYSYKNEIIASVWFRVGYCGVVFIAVTVFHYTVELLKIQKLKKIIFVSYLLGIICCILILSTQYLVKGVYGYFWGYYPTAGKFHPLFLVFFIGLISTSFTLLSFFLLFKKKEINGFLPRVTPVLTRAQIKYFFLAIFVYNFASVDFLPNYGIKVYPFGYIPTFLFILIIGYTIIKYRLMDIRIFVSRAVAFLISYSILLLFPFLFAFRMYPLLQQYLGANWWLVPGGLLLFLAIIAPLAYDHIRRGMENALLAEQKRYQKLLLQAASGMVREHNLNHLSKLIVYIVKKVVKIDFAAIFLYAKDKKTYQLKAIRDAENKYLNIAIIEQHPFISYLKNKSEPLLYEEIPSNVKNSLDLPLAVSLVVPSSIEQNLLGFVVLGEKLNREPYSEDDINVFKILSHQAAMAVENCLFFEEFKNVQQKIFTAEKLASIGGMADGVAHQIKNRLNHFSIAAGEMRSEIKDFMEKHPGAIEQTPDLKKSLDYVLDIAASMIDNVKRTDDVVRGILNYARVEEKGEFFSQFSLKEIVEVSSGLVRIKHEVAEAPLECDIGQDDVIYGVKAQIMECIFNLLDNHYEAGIEKRNKLSDDERAGFSPFIKLKLTQYDGTSRIEISDNGIGIRDEDKFKIFAPFFTTKSSYKSGSGIGMYVVKRIIEENHKGKIFFESTYMQGTKFVIELPRK